MLCPFFPSKAQLIGLNKLRDSNDSSTGEVQFEMRGFYNRDTENARVHKIHS